MKLYSLLNENNILIGQPAETMETALRALLATFGEVLTPERIDEVASALMEREMQHPTMIEEGVCIPHTRLEWLDRFLVGLMTPERPIPHPMEDESEVRLIFLILAPQNKNTMMLQTLAAIARLLKSKEIKTAMLKVKSEGRLLRLIEDSGIDVKKTLVAADVMTPITHSVTMDTVLVKAVDVLVDAPDEGIPVLSEKGQLVGELTSRELLVLGMPKYLDLILNPAMLDNFEPFENFFQHENSITVREVCRRDVATVEPNAPIVQVTHLMMTQQKRRVYVVSDGELKGVILRRNIVARVLHI